MLAFLNNILDTLYIFFSQTFPLLVGEYWGNWVDSFFLVNPVSLWIYFQIASILLLIFVFKWAKNTRFGQAIQLLVESVYGMFADILEMPRKHRSKTYVTTLFFVVLLANISWWMIDIVRVIFTDVEWLSSVILVPTTSLEFNGALAFVSIILMLKAQVDTLWGGKTFLEYVPLFGKNMITIERWKMPLLVYIPLAILVKIFDIGLSLFIGVLDIIGVGAKIISLSARLYGNMMSGWVLLTMLVVWIWGMTESLLGYNFPVIGPIILYLQWILVACIQAFVFPLLVAIFLKLSFTTEEE